MAIGQGSRVAARVFAIPEPDASDVAMGARPDAPPVPAPPVGQVVLAARRLATGPVAGFVVAESQRRQVLLGHQVFLGEFIVIRHRHLTSANPHRQAGSLLHDEGIGRNVVDGCHGHRVEALFPVGPGFARGPEDQVQADVFETGLPGPTRCINTASRGVCPFQDFQDVRHR